MPAIDPRTGQDPDVPRADEADPAPEQPPAGSSGSSVPTGVDEPDDGWFAL